MRSPTDNGLQRRSETGDKLVEGLFCNATTLAFSQNEFAQTVDARQSEFEWRILVGVRWNATIDRKCWWKTPVQDHSTFGRTTFWNRLKWRTNQRLTQRVCRERTGDRSERQFGLNVVPYVIRKSQGQGLIFMATFFSYLRYHFEELRKKVVTFYQDLVSLKC